MNIDLFAVDSLLLIQYSVYRIYILFRHWFSAQVKFIMNCLQSAKNEVVLMSLFVPWNRLLHSRLTKQPNTVKNILMPSLFGLNKNQSKW